VLTTAIGAFNGFISRVLSVHPLIVTLGIGFMVTGGLLAWTNGSPQGQAPAWLSDALSAGATMGPIHLPPVVAVWAGVAAVTIYVMSRTRFGRQLYAIGANPTAAEFALVRPRLMWTASFACGGFIAGVAGLMLAGFTGYGDLGSGDPYLFDTVAAVVAGGTSLLGGRGGYLRTVAGTLLLTELQIILLGFGFGPTTQEAAFGGVILVAVALYGRERHVRYRV
jgi:ribose transport system permease protein